MHIQTSGGRCICYLVSSKRADTGHGFPAATLRGAVPHGRGNREPYGASGPGGPGGPGNGGSGRAAGPESSFRVPNLSSDSP
eukprot:141703-Hanusia_phi.AAC.1